MSEEIRIPAPHRIGAARRARALAIVLALLPLVATLPAHAAPDDPAIRHACGKTLNLAPAEDDYQACAFTLSETLDRAVHAQAQAVAEKRAQDSCLTQGVSQDNPAFARCVLSAAVAQGDTAIGE